MLANFSPVLFNHFFADGETEAGTTGRGGKSRFVNAVEKFRRDTAAVILEINFHDFAAELRSPLQPDAQSAARVHGTESVHGEIEKHLLEAVGVGVD